MSVRTALERVIVVLGLLVPGFAAGSPGAYDPLAVPEGRPEILDLVVADEGRERQIPLRVFLPLERSPAPVVLFSHGLGGSREGSAYLGTHWALRGYVAV
ncbi:MAG TPA: dienelactone hydrolase, partial [Vicinamibacteria bacterium]|nr:dienelactone hydrolase [Vicinamibacteria bacterium]